jgi:hypothetical protein
MEEIRMMEMPVATCVDVPRCARFFLPDFSHCDALPDEADMDLAAKDPSREIFFHLPFVVYDAQGVPM